MVKLSIKQICAEMKPMPRQAAGIRPLYKGRSLGSVGSFMSQVSSARKVSPSREAALRALFDLHQLGVDLRDFQGEDLSRTQRVFQAILDQNISRGLNDQASRVGTISPTEEVDIFKSVNDDVDDSSGEQNKIHLYFDEAGQLKIEFYEPFADRPCGTYLAILKEQETERVSLENGFLVNIDGLGLAPFPDLLERYGMLPRSSRQGFLPFQNELFGAVFYDSSNHSFRLIDGYSNASIGLGSRNNIEHLSCGQRNLDFGKLLALGRQANPIMCFHVHPRGADEMLLSEADFFCVILPSTIYGKKRYLIPEAVIGDQSKVLKLCIPRRGIAFPPEEIISTRLREIYEAAKFRFMRQPVDQADLFSFIKDSGILNSFPQSRDKDLPTLLEAATDRGLPFMIESAELAFAPWFMYLTFDYIAGGYHTIKK